MKRILVTLLWVSFVAMALEAESVMIFVKEHKNHEIPQPRNASYLGSAVEDGVMEQLFETGHIVFDGSIGEASGVDRSLQCIQLKERALKGGARYAVLVDLKWDVPMSNSRAPSEISFSLFKTDSDVLVSGVVTPENILQENNQEDKSPALICFLMGKYIAKEILLKL